MEDVEGGGGSSEFLVVFLGLACPLTSSWQADCLESQMGDMLKVQEHMDLRLEERDEELRQLQSQSQVDGAQLAALSLQMQELISSVQSRAEVVGRDLEETNGRFDCHCQADVTSLFCFSSLVMWTTIVYCRNSQ